MLLVQDTGDLDISIEANAAAAGAAQADAREARASYDANYIKARNDLELEQAKYERNEYLYSIGAISQDTLDSVKQEYLASKAAFDVLADQVEGGSAASVESKAYTAEKAQHATDALRRQRESTPSTEPCMACRWGSSLSSPRRKAAPRARLPGVPLQSRSWRAV